MQHSKQSIPDCDPVALGGTLQLLRAGRHYFDGGQPLKVLTDINLTIAPGEMVAIVGASGSGKSTLLNILGCLDQVSEGSYQVAGSPVECMCLDHIAALRRGHFGFIFQHYHLLPHLTAAENIELPALYAGEDREFRKRRVIELLDLLGLSGLAGRLPAQLSGGQQQRVGIARALMNGGNVILADEPTGALDPPNALEVLKMLRELNESGRTVIMVTHDLQVARQADRIIELENGRISADYKNRLRIPGPRSSGYRWRFGAPRASRSRLVTRDAVRIASLALIRFPLRTVLSAIGIMAGIAAVTSVMALGNGAKEQVIREINGLGVDSMQIYPGRNWNDSSVHFAGSLSQEDAAAVDMQPFVESVSPTLSTSATLKVGIKTSIAQVTGVGADYFRLHNMTVDSGRFFDASAIESHALVAVIDENTRLRLFEKWEEPIGREISIGNTVVTVVGVEGRKAGRPVGSALQVYMPHTSVGARLLGRRHVDTIAVRVSKGTPSAVAETAITRALAANHGVKDFFISTFSEMSEATTKVTRTLTNMILSVAAISLVVGGIGVMNIMLVAVAERTGEIGIRMAVGATRRNILHQFLLEGVSMCALGGACGLALSGAVAVFFDDLLAYPMQFSASTLAIAIAASVGVGVISAFFPALRASRLNPVHALTQQ